MTNNGIKLKALVISPAYIPLLIIILATLIQGLFNSFEVVFGATRFQLMTFLNDPYDRFADFVKYTLSLPGPALLYTDQWAEFVRSYLIDNPYGGIASLVHGDLSHFHLMPLVVFICLVSRYAFTMFNPMVVFFFIISILVISLGWFLFAYVKDKKLFIFTMLALFLSYPFLFFLVRGNIGAGITGVALIIALLLCWQSKKPLLVAWLFAIAVNVRPNAVILIGTFFFFYNFRKALFYVGLTIFGIILLFLLSFYFAHSIYLDYNFTNFFEALRIYHNIYVLRNDGLAYNSSLLEAIKWVLHLKTAAYVFLLEKIITLFSVVLVLFSYYLFAHKKLTALEGSFILSVLYVVGTGIFADYHLIFFFSYIILLCKKLTCSPKLTVSELIILLVTVFVSIPKNYILHNGAFYQVLLNPMILIMGMLVILFSALRRFPRSLPKEVGSD